jgi:signal transduction histidine kinase
LSYENQLKEVANVSRKIVEYENKLAMVNQERERLEAALKSKSAELNERDKLARDL